MGLVPGNVSRREKKVNPLGVSNGQKYADFHSGTSNTPLALLMLACFKVSPKREVVDIAFQFVGPRSCECVDCLPIWPVESGVDSGGDVVS